MTIIHASLEYDEHGNPHVITDDPNSDDSSTDWAYLEAMTDDEIRSNAESDPDTVLLSDEQRERGLLGREIRLLRQGLGLTHQQFADRYGIAVETVEGWERGRRWSDATSKTLLRVIVTNPDIVARVVDADRSKKADAAD